MSWRPNMSIGEYYARRKERRQKRAAKRRTLFRGTPQAQTTTALKKKLWQLVSYFVRMRDRRLYNGLCRICARRPITLAYHIIPRGYAATCYDPENLAGACQPCNWWELQTRGQNPLQVREKHIRIFGAEKIAALEEKAKQAVKITRVEMLDLIGEFKLRIQGLTRRPLA